MTNKWTDSDAKNAGFVFDNHNLGLTILPHVGLKAGDNRWLYLQDAIALRDWLNEKIEPEKAVNEMNEHTIKDEAIEYGEVLAEVAEQYLKVTDPDDDSRQTPSEVRKCTRLYLELEAVIARFRYKVAFAKAYKE